ncbi:MULTISPECIES: TorF family putative porin [unclassified Sphingomonas]|uniref:TorF family putative porin n=1 Tax=Sphingomonas TaxID=13687 RepID=UPI00096810BD|nr:MULTISPECIES: TorF family putative porin [unclassified Sphingomonas]MBN8813455.1 hypothetical protein [Sphingomonas sp.]OJY52477.1 MAG: hypothetical protein BGP17_08560 [Sphingomonas sp. 67-41]
MRMSVLATAAITILSISTPAFAQEETEAPPAVTVSGGATVVSDYRFRGISQSNKRPAIQGTFTVSHESGVYATVWGSSINGYIASNSSELDLIAGYKHTFGSTTVDVGVTYYVYSDSPIPNTDFAEPYVAVSQTLGPVTGKISAVYAPKQNALTLNGVTKEENFYLAGDVSAGIPGTPVSVSAHLGHNFSPSYLTFGQKYTDWSLGASYTWNHLTLGVSYVDTDADIFVGSRNISKGGVVASLGVSF